MVKGVLNGYSSTRVSLWDALMFGRLAMGFANVRAGTRVLMLVLVLVQAGRGGDGGAGTRWAAAQARACGALVRPCVPNLGHFISY